MLHLPDSLKSYFDDKNPAIKTAVDDLIPMLNGKKMPVTDWNEQRSFHKALLMAAKVRADYAEFLFGLHDAIWNGCAKLTDEDPEEYSPSDIWENNEIPRDFWLNDERTHWISLNVIMHDEKGRIIVRAYCTLSEDSDSFDVPDFVKAPEGWSNEKPSEDWINGIYSNGINLHHIIADPENAIAPLFHGAKSILSDIIAEQNKG